MRNGKIDDAESFFLAVLEGHPEDVDAIAGLGNVRSHQKRYDEAERLFKQAVASGKNTSDVHALMGELYGVQGRADESAEAYTKAFELDPEEANWGLLCGRALNRANRFAEAETVLRKVVELDPEALTPDHVGVYTLLADSLRGQTKLDDALRTYMKAQTTYASDKMARAGAAFVYEAKSDIKHALDEWSAYIQRDCCSDFSRTVAHKKISELQEKG